MKPAQTQLHAEIERRTLEDLLEAANAFYDNPVNRQAFEAWEKTEEGKQYAAYFKHRHDARKSGKTESIL